MVRISVCNQASRSPLFSLPLSVINVVAGLYRLYFFTTPFDPEVPLQDPLYHTDHFIIQKLDFEGDFFALTKVFNQLQATSGIGVVRAVSYKVIGLRSGENDGKKLELEVYLETVK